MAVVFKIDGRMLQCDGEVIAIGRAPSNQISLPNDTRLAPVQAVLKRVAGRWIIESQNGETLRVGDGRPTLFAWLDPGDSIYLTEAGPEVTFLPGTDSAPDSRVATPMTPHAVPPLLPHPEYGALPPVVATSASKRSAEPRAVVSPTTKNARIAAGADDGGIRHDAATVPPWILFASAGGMAALLLICIGMYLGGTWSSEPSPALKNDSPPVPKPMPPGTTTADPHWALYCLQMRASDGTTVQLGTAWALDSRRLVTTGDAAQGINLNSESHPNLLARHTLSKVEFNIAGRTLHPQYEAAAGRLGQARREILRLQTEWDLTANPDEQKIIDAQIDKLDFEATVAAEELVNVNIAILDLGRDTQMALPWATAPAMKIGQEVTLLGHPLPTSEPLVNPDRPEPVQQQLGRLYKLESARVPIAPMRCAVRFDAALKGQNWSGSPVLNSEGIVVGLYARPTPLRPGSAATPITTHDITVIDGVRDWLRSR